MKNSFHTMMRKFSASVFKLTAVSNTPMPFGNLKLYGFEHYLRQVEDVDVRVNWQLDTVISSKHSYRKPKTQPKIETFNLPA